MSASTLYQQGKLSDAIQACNEEVRDHPDDMGKRAFLAELLCFSGNYERADKQLDTIVHQNPESMMSAGTWRHTIRAALSREEFFKAGRIPEFTNQPTDNQQLRLEAGIYLREDDKAKALELLNKAEVERAPCSGECDGEYFDDFRDLDDFFGGTLEVIGSNGNYYWVDFSELSEIKIEKPSRPLELLWLPATITLKSGVSGQVYLPAVYPTPGDEQANLGRQTDWLGDEGEPVIGVGLRTFLIGENAKPITSIQTIKFTAAQ